MRMYVVACSSPSLISSAAIVQGSPFISQLLASCLLKPSEEEDFLGKKWLRRTANGRPGTDATSHQCTSKRKSKRNTMCATAISGIRTKAIPSEEVRFPVTDEGWEGVARLGCFTLGAEPRLFFTAGNQRLPLSCTSYPH